MYPVLEDLAVVAIVGFFFLVLFVVLVLGLLFTEGLKWLANVGTHILGRLIVSAESKVNVARAPARIREKLSSAPAVALHPCQKRGWPAERPHMAHEVRQFVTGHGLFRS